MCQILAHAKSGVRSPKHDCKGAAWEPVLRCLAGDPAYLIMGTRDGKNEVRMMGRTSFERTGVAVL